MGFLDFLRRPFQTYCPTAPSLDELLADLGPKKPQRRATGISCWFNPNNRSQNAIVFRKLLTGPQTGMSLRMACMSKGNPVNDIGHRVSDVRRSLREVGVTLHDTSIKGKNGKRYDQYHLTQEGLERLAELKPKEV